MRFMILVKATPASEGGAPPDEALASAMTRYHEQLAEAGVLLDACALQPSSKGWRVQYAHGRRTMTDGPFAQARDLVAGYTLIQVASREEALEWTRRYPAPFGDGAGGEIEVRQVFELDGPGPGEAAGRLRTGADSAR